jgi:hypothetical protein
MLQRQAFPSNHNSLDMRGRAFPSPWGPSVNRSGMALTTTVSISKERPGGRLWRTRVAPRPMYVGSCFELCAMGHALHLRWSALRAKTSDDGSWGSLPSVGCRPNVQAHGSLKRCRVLDTTAASSALASQNKSHCKVQGPSIVHRRHLYSLSSQLRSRAPSHPGLGSPLTATATRPRSGFGPQFLLPSAPHLFLSELSSMACESRRVRQIESTRPCSSPPALAPRVQL